MTLTEWTKLADFFSHLQSFCLHLRILNCMWLSLGDYWFSDRNRKDPKEFTFNYKQHSLEHNMFSVNGECGLLSSTWRKFYYNYGAIKDTFCSRRRQSYFYDSISFSASLGFDRLWRLVYSTGYKPFIESILSGQPFLSVSFHMGDGNTYKVGSYRKREGT